MDLYDEEKMTQDYFEFLRLRSISADPKFAGEIPIPPGGRAMTTYQQLRTGRTPQRRKRFRETLLDLTSAQLTDAIATHLTPQIERAPVVTFAEKEFFATRKIDLPLWEA